MRKFLSIPHLVRFFIINECWLLSNAFSTINMIMWLFLSLACWWSDGLHWFIFKRWTSQPCIPGIDLSWSWCISLFLFFHLVRRAQFSRIRTTISSPFRISFLNFALKTSRGRWWPCTRRPSKGKTQTESGVELYGSCNFRNVVLGVSLKVRIYSINGWSLPHPPLSEFDCGRLKIF